MAIGSLRAAATTQMSTTRAEVGMRVVVVAAASVRPQVEVVETRKVVEEVETTTEGAGTTTVMVAAGTTKAGVEARQMAAAVVRTTRAVAAPFQG